MRGRSFGESAKPRGGDWSAAPLPVPLPVRVHYGKSALSFFFFFFFPFSLPFFLFLLGLPKGDGIDKINQSINQSM
jgi:hypothetical protein